MRCFFPVVAVICALSISFSVSYAEKISICASLAVPGSDLSEWVAAFPFTGDQYMFFSEQSYYIVESEEDPCSLRFVESGGVPSAFSAKAVVSLGADPETQRPVLAIIPLSNGNVVQKVTFDASGKWKVVSQLSLSGVPSTERFTFSDFTGNEDDPEFIFFFSSKFIISVAADSWKVVQIVAIDTYAPSTYSVPLLAGAGFTHYSDSPVLYLARGGMSMHLPAQTVAFRYGSDGTIVTSKPVVTYLQTTPQTFFYSGVDALSSEILWTQAYPDSDTADIFNWDISSKSMDSVEVKLDASRGEVFAQTYVVDPYQAERFLIMSGAGYQFTFRQIVLSESHPNVVSEGPTLSVSGYRLPEVAVNADASSYGWALVGSGSQSSNEIMLVSYAYNDAGEVSLRSPVVRDAPTFPPCGVTNANSCPDSGICCELSNTYRCLQLCPYSP
eukprot:ANDGO_07935.mRNA.1 hypothetical protein